jgi:hypothetical protein
MSTTNMSTKEAEAAVEPACSKCECSIERCSFCEEAGCSVAVCYGCMIVALGQTAAQPHKHGG